MLTDIDLQGFADAQCTPSSVRSTCSTFRPPRPRVHYPGHFNCNLQQQKGKRRRAIWARRFCRPAQFRPAAAVPATMAYAKMTLTLETARYIAFTGLLCSSLHADV